MRNALLGTETYQHMPKLLSHSVASQHRRLPASTRHTGIRVSGGVAGRPGGFTLLELMIVVVILGVMTGVAAPRMHSLIERQQVDRAAQVVASDVRTAFTSAARGRVPVRVTIAAPGARYTITNRTTGDTIVQRNLGTGDLRVASVTATTGTLDVFPNGIAGTGVTLVVGDPKGYSRRVMVSRVGYVRVVQ
jgi:type IV fimbrial biogenesis protein FimT